MTMNKNSTFSDTAPIIMEESLEKKPLDEEPIDITKSVAKEDKHLVHPAGVGGAVLGFIFGGPILSALLGFSAAYAVRKKNSTGNVARKIGEVTVSVQEKIAKAEAKNHFMERTKKSINDRCDDEKEKSAAFKTRAFLVSTWLAASKYTKENKLLERGVEETGKGLEFIGRSIEKVKGKPTNFEEDMVSVSTDKSRDEAGEDIQTAELLKVEIN